MSLTKKFDSKSKVNSVYGQSARRKFSAFAILTVIISIYAFFFLSNSIFDTSKELLGESKIGVPITCSMDRQVTIYRATYDETKKMFEIVMTIDNLSPDGVDDYYYYLIPSGTGNYRETVVNVHISDSIIIVLRCESEKFDSAKLVFAPRLSDDIAAIPNSAVSSLSFNANNITTSTITEVSRSDYVNIKYDVMTANLKTELSDLTATVASLNIKIDTVKRSSDEIKKNMELYTSDEKSKAEIRIANNNSEINRLKSDIAQLEKEKSKLEQKIKEIEDMRGGL